MAGAGKIAASFHAASNWMSSLATVREMSSPRSRPQALTTMTVAITTFRMGYTPRNSARRPAGLNQQRVAGGARRILGAQVREDPIRRDASMTADPYYTFRPPLACAFAS